MLALEEIIKLETNLVSHDEDFYTQDMQYLLNPVEKDDNKPFFFCHF